MKSAIDVVQSLSSRKISRAVGTSLLLTHKQLWIWPLVAAAVLVVVGWWVRTNIEATIKSAVAGDLEAVLAANVTALEIWIEMEQAIARAIAQDPELEHYVSQLGELANADANSARELLKSPIQDELFDALDHAMHEHRYTGFVVSDSAGRVLASPDAELVGKQVPDAFREFVAVVFDGRTVVTPPFASMIPLTDSQGEVRVGMPTMFVAAPIRNAESLIVAVLALRIDPDVDFSRILRTSTIGETGETYAFNAAGMMLSQSRFDDTLKQIGLIPDRPDSHSTLNLVLKDPGADLVARKTPTQRRSEQPLTEMAAAAVAGGSGVKVDGYRDYRGIPVIGAWQWLPKLGFGVATELDVQEAFRPLYVLRTAFWSLFTLLALSAIAIFVFTVLMARLRRSERRAALHARQLGQYSLDEKIGVGGMGVVYKGHHAMLRRPTAIKLLDVDKVTDEAVQRFEREVQLTCQLTHPNTIAIYDYGRTPEGVFYYAMEYLDGISLESLVQTNGPQPEGRVIQILAQICGSLAEAHERGLVHRDIKPANVLLNQRGGQFDVVKVLDFGLVKAVGANKQANVTAPDRMAGTPLYMAPEAIQTPAEVGPAADLYAVGAVGYYLLTGTPVFSGESIIAICHHHVNDPPVPPSQRLKRPISADLESLLMQCLAKRPDDRPTGARQLAEALLACPAASSWTSAQAEQWWRCHTPIAAGATTVESIQPTQPENATDTTLVQQHTP